MPAFGTVEVRFNKVPQLSGNLRKLAREEVETAAIQTEALAKVNSPVDTGALRNSIQAAKGAGELTWEVGVGQEYGLFIEFGTVHQGARPFMTPAAEMVGPQFLRRMDAIVDEAAR